MKTILQDIKDLLSFEIKHSKRHGLERVSITVPRAILIIHEINDRLKEHKNQTGRA